MLSINIENLTRTCILRKIKGTTNVDEENIYAIVASQHWQQLNEKKNQQPTTTHNNHTN